MLPMQKYEEWRSPDNRLLASLPVKDYERLLPHLQNTSLSSHEVLHETGETVEYVYFPNDAIITLLSSVSRNSTVEVGLVGREGMVGVSILFGSKVTPYQVVALAPGGVMRMKAEVLKREFKRSSSLQDVLLPYAQAVLTQNAQSASCHRYHTPQERLCRLLLMIEDRAGADEFRATHEFMAQMLGTRRATVTEAAHDLQQKGLIAYRRGLVKVLNRQALEKAACSCYRIIREQFDELPYA
jgi:CRP-like cAMP-binding protein